MLNQVTSVKKNRAFHPWERINRLSGLRDDTGSPWACSHQVCIAYIEKGCRFYIKNGDRRLFLEVAVSAAGQKYLRSDPHQDAQQSLLRLPDCSA